jgi:hypothetical protein
MLLRHPCGCVAKALGTINMECLRARDVSVEATSSIWKGLTARVPDVQDRAVEVQDLNTGPLLATDGDTTRGKPVKEEETGQVSGDTVP